MNATVTTGMATTWDRSDGGRGFAGGTFGNDMSLTEISTRIAFVAGLALIALLVIGWRKTAKDTPTAAGHGFVSDDAQHPDVELLTGTDVGRLAASKGLRVLGLGAIAILLGIVITLGVSLSLSFLVTNILDRL